MFDNVCQCLQVIIQTFSLLVVPITILYKEGTTSMDIGGCNEGDSPNPTKVHSQSD